MPFVGVTLAGRYRIDAILGAGGMATVYRARDLRLDRDVAVKVLLPNLAQDPIVAQRFDLEARALAAVNHPAVVGIFDVAPGDPTTGTEPFFVMELCEGGSLADRFAAEGALPPDELIPVVVRIADGIAALHERGIIHRDVKPHNVLLTPGGAKLADFGLVRTGVPTDLTATGTAVGTLAYLAPEMLAGEPPTPAVDVYSLGVGVFEGLTGALPRPAETIAELVDARRMPPPRVSEMSPELGEAFDEPLRLALSAEPSMRPDPLQLAGFLTTALGRWTRERKRAPGVVRGATGGPRAAQGIVATEAGVSPTASTAPVGGSLPGPPPVPGPVVDAAAETLPAAALVQAAGRPAMRQARPAGSADTGQRGPRFAWRRTALGATLLLALVLGALIGIGSNDGRRAASLGGETATPTATNASPSPSATPTPSPTPTPTPTPTAEPTPTPDPFEAARTALATVRDAIDFARGAGGLRGKDANDLVRLADDVDAALAAGDAAQAFDAAARLVQQVTHLIDEDRLGGAAGDRLLAACLALRDAIPVGA